MRGSLITRIPNDGAQQAAFGAAFQDVNGCAAHDWGQVLTFRGKIGPHFRAFTTFCRMGRDQLLPRM